jgi:hypothetical protein
MQIYTQVFAGAQTWQLNVPGNYFTLFGSTNVVNIRFYKQGKLLNTGEIKGVLAGIEAGPFKDVKADGIAFDRVEIDTSAADTITLGIGDGSVRYNRSQGSVQITSGQVKIQDSVGSVFQRVPFTGLLDINYWLLPVIESGFGYGAAYGSVTALAANTPAQVFAPGSNPNGAVVWDCFLATAAATSVACALIAKASAPASVIDGDIIHSVFSQGALVQDGWMMRAKRIVAGKGLYIISGLAETAAMHTVLYTLF